MAPESKGQYYTQKAKVIMKVLFLMAFFLMDNLWIRKPDIPFFLHWLACVIYSALTALCFYSSHGTSSLKEDACVTVWLWNGPLGLWFKSLFTSCWCSFRRLWTFRREGLAGRNGHGTWDLWWLQLTPGSCCAPCFLLYSDVNSHHTHSHCTAKMW